MKKSLFLTTALMLVFMLVLSGCNLPFKIVPANSDNAPATEEMSAAAATATEQPATEAPTVEAIASETPTPDALPTNTVAPTQIVHSSLPTDTYYDPNQIAVDCNTGARLASGSMQINVSGCDYWNREYLERPADSNGGTYIPALDILWSQVGKASPWIFLRIKVNSLSDQPAGYQAGFEIDKDLNSRGDYLLLVNEPKSSQWATDGVQVWEDSNHDVGGGQAFAYDQNQSNGYETELFNSGVGSDPDLAWARISPRDNTIIEFALKASLLGDAKTFAWWA